MEGRELPRAGKGITVDGVRTPYERVLLNWPPELVARLKEMAVRERRPLTRQIQVLVEHALESLG